MVYTDEQLKLMDRVDNLMFHLEKSSDQSRDLLKAGGILQKLGLLNDPTDLKKVAKTYNKWHKERVVNEVNKKG